MASFYLYIYIYIFFGSPRITPAAPIGLWTLSPRFSAVFAHSEPTILFSTCSAVSHPKTRDFRLYESAIPFFLTGQRFPILKTRDFHFRSLPLESTILLACGFRSYENPSTNQKTKALNQSEARKFPQRAQCTTTLRIEL